jgi:antitoxin (DNA-binding transcriptional repressor) of toxin-antitoxin stability system
MAWTAPPPTPSTLRIELLKNDRSKRFRPFARVVAATHTSGTRASRKAPMMKPVIIRSVARRGPSTRREVRYVAT